LIDLPVHEVAPQLTSSIAPRSITRSWRQVLFFWGRLLVSMLVWQLFKEVVSEIHSFFASPSHGRRSRWCGLDGRKNAISPFQNACERLGDTSCSLLFATFIFI
jgi:hypothetical protein